MIAFIPALTLLASVLTSASAAPLKPVVDTSSVTKFERCLQCEVGAVNGLKGSPNSLLGLKTGSGANTGATVVTEVDASASADGNGDGGRNGRGGSLVKANAKLPLALALGLQGNLTSLVARLNGQGDLRSYLLDIDTALQPGINTFANLDANAYNGVNSDALVKALAKIPVSIYTGVSTYPATAVAASSGTALQVSTSLGKLLKNVNAQVKGLGAQLNAAVNASPNVGANAGAGANTGSGSGLTVDPLGKALLSQLFSSSCPNN